MVLRFCALNEQNMSGSLVVCKIPSLLKEIIKKFRFSISPTMNALILKIDRKQMELTVEESLKDSDLEEIKNELPAQQPRFVIVSYKLNHADGRTSYPLCLIFFSPQGSSPEMQMLYVGSLNNLVNECSFVKSAIVRDLDEITEDFLKEMSANVKKIGGVKAMLKQRYLMDQTRAGDLVGEDKFGNKYYEDNSYFIPRNRYVVFPDRVWLDYDASSVPPEWHRWLHHICDASPTTEPLAQNKWILEHRENKSIFLDGKYVPYSTTRPKIEAWTPRSSKSK